MEVSQEKEKSEGMKATDQVDSIILVVKVIRVAVKKIGLARVLSGIQLSGKRTARKVNHILEAEKSRKSQDSRKPEGIRRSRNVTVLAIELVPKLIR